MDRVEFRLFCDDDIDGLVEMWRESRDGWPPGFFGAAEISAASVAHEENCSGALFSVLALLKGRVVGCCRTSPYGGEPEASYVSVINVLPGMQGRGIGKALLLDAVRRSAEMGLDRIDLHTWPANMKAVPLYKKTGFFWVPDTKVYMQNYMPRLLRMEAFTRFLDGEDWYRCFSRDPAVAPDLVKTDSGRQVFPYVFTRGDERFEASFDKAGRCLSGIEYPGFRAGLSLSGATCFTGKPVSIEVEGVISPCTVRTGDSLECGELCGNHFSVTPLPVRVPFSPFEPVDRVTVESDGIELGVGIMAEEEVALHLSQLRFLPVGAVSVSLGVKCLGRTESVPVSYSVDGGDLLTRHWKPGESTYQTLTLELPALEKGVHSLSVRIGENGYRETVVLVAGIHTNQPVGIDTRLAAIVVDRDMALVVDRRGGMAWLMVRGEGQQPLDAGKFFIIAGPPIWQTDLYLQRFDLDISDGSVAGKTPWPSRPGMEYGFQVRLDPAGYAEGKAWVDNGSATAQKLVFRAFNRFTQAFREEEQLFPVPAGLLRMTPVENQIPDWEEDMSKLSSGLAAPWFGAVGQGMSVLCHFKDWPEMEYHLPGTEETTVQPGDRAESPFFRMLLAGGGERELLRRAEALGWEVGDRSPIVPFLSHNLQPIMASGTEVFLAHPLHGERDAEIGSRGRRVCRGRVKRERSISGVLRGKGPVDVSLVMAGRETVLPVFLVGRSSSVSAEMSDGILSLSNRRMKALLDPRACGQVFSVSLDGAEYLLSSRPEPSEFAWEKPWFGGIHPRFGGTNRPYPLEDSPPFVENFQCSHGGLTGSGWRMTWKIDHKDFGSAMLQWSATMLPGVPLLTTELICTALNGHNSDGELSIRGFLQPGGSVEDEILSCQKFPSLRQGRKHAGAWVPLGRWGRVESSRRFVEATGNGDGSLFGEDYGALGCHISFYSEHGRDRRLRVDWLFGAGDGDCALAEILRKHK